MLVYSKLGQNELGSRQTINDRLTIHSKVFGLYSAYKGKEAVINLLKQACDFSESEELKITVLHKLAQVFNTTAKELEKRVLVISPTSAKDLAELASAN